jgi:hypothetical protein
MSRTATAFGIAAALSLGASLGAQTTTTTDKGREVTVTGCLARGSDGAYMLNNAKIDENASSSRSSASSATTTTGSATTTGAPSPTTTGTTGSSSVGTTAASPTTTTAGSPMSWKLEGGSDLERHVGHKIQVTGRTEWNEHSSASSSPAPATTTGTSGASSTMSSGPKLDVSSVKMISTSCQ